LIAGDTKYHGSQKFSLTDCDERRRSLLQSWTENQFELFLSIRLQLVQLNFLIRGRGRPLVKQEEVIVSRKPFVLLFFCRLPLALVLSATCCSLFPRCILPTSKLEGKQASEKPFSALPPLESVSHIQPRAIFMFIGWRGFVLWVERSPKVLRPPHSLLFSHLKHQFL